VWLLCLASTAFGAVQVDLVLKNSASTSDQVSVINGSSAVDSQKFTNNLLMVKKATTGTMSFTPGRVPYPNARANGADQFTLTANASANAKVTTDVGVSNLAPRWTITSCQKISGNPTANWTHSVTGCVTSGAPGTYFECYKKTGSGTNPSCSPGGSDVKVASTEAEGFTAGNRVCRQAKVMYVTQTASTRTVHWTIAQNTTGYDYCTCPSSGSCSSGSMRFENEFEDEWVGVSDQYAKL